MKNYNFPKQVIFTILQNKFLVKLFVKFNFKFILYFFSLVLISLEKRNNLAESKKYNFLCLSRPIFNADIDALASITDECRFINIPKEYFLFLLKALYPKKVYSHQDYFENDLNSKSYLIYKKTIHYITSKLVKKFRINGVITANYNYSWQQEIALFCNKIRSIKFIVILKEGINTLGTEGEDELLSTVKYFKRYTNHKFIGDLLFVYNKLIKKALINSNIEGIDESKIIVSGVPRIDKYFKISYKNNNQITFFSFSIEDKVRHLNLDSEEYNQIKLLSDKYHIEIIKFAMKNKKFKLTIKTKANKKYVNEINELIRKNKLKITSNIQITNEGDAFQLIKKSSLIIGFNSTTLQESLAANRKVICCDFRGTKIRDQFEGYENIINYFDNYRKLEKLIKSNSKNIISKKNTKVYLKETLGNNSRDASQVIIRKIKSQI